jgi:hypothetical protein
VKVGRIAKMRKPETPAELLDAANAIKAYRDLGGRVINVVQDYCKFDLRPKLYRPELLASHGTS